MPLLYAPFTKVEETADGTIVEGIATTETPDTEREIVDYDSVKLALPDYAQWGNIREMHQPSAAGKALAITPDDDTRSVLLRALIVDPSAQHKVLHEVYKGFSIGGKATGKVVKRDDGSTYTRRYVTLLSEISLVDRPANPDARFSIVKFQGGAMAEEPGTPPLDERTIAAITKLAGQALAKQATTDPSKIVGLIQQARNELELAGDMDGAALMTQAIALIQQAVGDAEEDATEPPEDAGEPPDAAAPPPVAAAARATTLKKAGRALSQANLTSMENTVKTLLQMMAAAGSTKAQKAIAAMSEGEMSEGQAMAAAIGSEFQKGLEPLAAALLNLNDRLTVIERTPMPGGPMIRPVPKQIGSSPERQPAQKPQPSVLIKQQLDDLSRKARTDPNPTFRQEYQRQYDALREQYA
jgi:hypothetical protein